MKSPPQRIFTRTRSPIALLVPLLLAAACSGNDVTELTGEDVVSPSLNELTDDELSAPIPAIPGGFSERRPIEASLEVEGEDLVVSLRNSTREAALVSLSASIDAPDGSYLNDNAAEVRVPAGEELRVMLADLDGFDVSGHDWSRSVVQYAFTLDNGRHGVQTTELAILEGRVVPQEEAIASGRQRPDLVLEGDDATELKQASTFKACFSNVIDLLPQLTRAGGPPTPCPAGTPDPTGGGCLNGPDFLIQNRQVVPMPTQLFSALAPDGTRASGPLDATGCTRALPRQVGNWTFGIWLYSSRVFYMSSDGLLHSKDELVTVSSSGEPTRRNVQMTSAFRPWQAAVFLSNNTFQRVGLIGALPPSSTGLRISPFATAGAAAYCHTGAEGGGCTTRNTLVVNVGIANERGTIAHETGHFIHKEGAAANLLASYAYSEADAGNPPDACAGRRRAGHDIETVEWQSAAHIEGLAEFFKAVTYNNYTAGSNCRSPIFFGSLQVAVLDCEARGNTLERLGCVEWSNSNFGKVGVELDWAKLYWDYLTDKGGNMATYMAAERAVTSWPSATGGNHIGALFAQLNSTEENKWRAATAGNIWEGTNDQ